MFGGGDNENLGPFTQRLMFPNLPLHLHLLPGASISTATAAVAGDDELPKRDERVPPWNNQETRDFIGIRGELEKEFSLAKRSKWKNLWEMVAAKMKERGYRRSAEQCKSKWKNLVNRYKGKESSDPDNGEQFQFFDELHALFTTSTNNVHQLQLESEAGSQQAKKRPRRTIRDQSSEDVSEDEEDYESDEVKLAKSNVAPKKNIEKEKRPRTKNAEKPSRQHSLGSTNNSGRTVENIQEMLKDFFQQQLRIEMQWRETMEKRAREREVFEQEWRSSMEKLERDKMMIEQAWRQREEQRRMREENRAEKRDALLTTLLNKLIGENHP